MKISDTGEARYVDIRISVNGTRVERVAMPPASGTTPAAEGGSVMARDAGLADILYPRDGRHSLAPHGESPVPDRITSDPGGGVDAEATDFDQVFLRAEEKLREMERALREPARVVITLGVPARPTAASGPASEVAAPYRSPLRTAGMAAASYAVPGRSARSAIIDIEI